MHSSHTYLLVLNTSTVSVDQMSQIQRDIHDALNDQYDPQGQVRNQDIVDRLNELSTILYAKEKEATQEFTDWLTRPSAKSSKYGSDMTAAIQRGREDQNYDHKYSHKYD